jgi:hypothetical protein
VIWTTVTFDTNHAAVRIIGHYHQSRDDHIGSIAQIVGRNVRRRRIDAFDLVCRHTAVSHLRFVGPRIAYNDGIVGHNDHGCTGEGRVGRGHDQQGIIEFYLNERSCTRRAGLNEFQHFRAGDGTIGKVNQDLVPARHGIGCGG